jgi:hypothetical protein
MAIRLPSSNSYVFTAVVVAALALGIFRRLLGLDAPLWLDEAFTGAIAIQPSFSGLIEDCLRDVPGPVYYWIIWAWEKVFGAGNISLRAPSLLFGVAAPILIMLKGHPDRFTRLMWAAFAALWIPGFSYATEARAYALLFLLGSAQIILFMRMMSAPTLRNAAVWSGLSALFLLTHYHSGLVTGLQGLAYLLLKRREAFRTWPAALLFAPAAAWMAFHLPLVLRFSTPEVAWQNLLGLTDIIAFPSNVIGTPRFAATILAVIAAATLWEACLRLRDRSLPPVGRVEALAVGASVLAVAIVFGMGFLRPNFTFRYLISFMPGVLLGAAIWTRVMARRFQPLPWFVLGGLLLSVVWEAKSRAGSSDWRSELSWEQAATDLAERGVNRLIFVWDNPTTAIIAPSLMARVGSFFFDRAGLEIPAKSMTLPVKQGVDPNAALAAAADRPGDAVIWIFDLNVRRTAALGYPPALEKLDPSFACRNHGGERRRVVVCYRSGGGAAGGPSKRPTFAAM